MFRPFVILALIIGSTGGAQADVDWKAYGGSVLEGLIGSNIESALERNGGGDEPYFRPGEDHIDPRHYTLPDDYNLPNSPAKGVSCFPRQELCFDSDGRISSQWTDTVYGRTATGG